MTVWIVNPFDNLPPEGYRPQRYWLMARAFAQAGHQVTYWTSDFSHAHKAPRLFKETVAPDGFRLTLVPTMPYPANICLRRVRSHRALARTWRQMAAASPERPDVVIASLPPLSLASAALAFCRTVGARFVVDVQDAWPETFYRVAPAWLFAPLRAVARRIYRLGIDLPPRPATHSPSRHLNLLYLGAMGKSYDLETVIDAVKEMADAELDLAGTGPKEKDLRARAADCPRIRFHGYLDAAALQDLFARAHAGVIPMFPDSCVGVPNKLADYAAAGLRIVNSLPGETADLIARFAAGAFYAAGDVQSFKDAVSALRRPAPDFASDAFRDFFDARRLYAGYVGFIQTLTEQL